MPKWKFERSKNEKVTEKYQSFKGGGEKKLQRGNKGRGFNCPRTD